MRNTIIATLPVAALTSIIALAMAYDALDMYYDLGIEEDNRAWCVQNIAALEAILPAIEAPQAPQAPDNTMNPLHEDYCPF